jgi:hypothetical protein
MQAIWRSLALVSMVVMPLVAGCSADAATDDGDETDADVAALSGCSSRTEVWLWAPSDPLTPVTGKLTPDLACTHYYVGLPLNVSSLDGDPGKTHFHVKVKDEIDRVHARGTNFHAVAEFNVGAWRQWIQESPGTRNWHNAGLKFRTLMDEAGFDLHKGNSDTWYIQELGSTLVAGNAEIQASEVRANAVQMARGLYEGGKTRKLGAVTRAGIGQMSFSADGAYTAHKRNLKDFLTDGAFWTGMDRYIRWWQEEVYADPHAVCVAGATIGERARAINDFTMHMPRLAAAGPAAAAPARSFLARTYTPLLQGTWLHDDGYGNTKVTGDQMEAMLSLQVYATRAWSEAHRYPDNRIGFAWNPAAVSEAQTKEVDVLGTRLARAINGAYKEGSTGGASFACSPSGAFTLCDCRVAGAKTRPQWGSFFDTWD